MKRIIKIIALSAYKLLAMSGGYVMLFLSLALAFVMFYAANGALNAKAPTSLKLVYVDNDGTSVSSELIAAIRNANGTSVELVKCISQEEAELAAAFRFLRDRGVDAVLTPTFDDAEAWLRAHWKPGDLMISHGCGDIELLNEQIARHGDTPDAQT